LPVSHGSLTIARVSSDRPISAQEDAASARSPLTDWLRLLGAGVVTLFALSVLAWQVHRAGPVNVLERLIHASPVWIGLALALTAARFVVFALRLAAITARVAPCSTLAFVPIVLASQFVSLILPGLRAGSAYLRAHLAGRRFSGGTALHLGPNIVDQLGSGLAWIIAALTVLPWAARSTDALVSRRSGLIGVAIALLLVCVAWLLGRNGSRLLAWLDKPRPGRVGYLASSTARALRGTGTLLFDFRANAAALAGGLAFAAFTAAAQYATLVAVGEPVPVWMAVLTVTLGGAAGTIAHTPGGLGATEAAQVAFLTSQGIPLESATSAVLLARALNYALVATAGGTALATEWNSGRMRGLLGRAGPATKVDRAA
jgi:undecaprenyl-diphosphatase